jgi:YVTN family beta-propeller protein
MLRRFGIETVILLVALAVAGSMAVLPGAAAAQGDVNLQVVSLTVPDGAFLGGPVSGIVVRIRNAGTDDITWPFYVSFHISADGMITTGDSRFVENVNEITTFQDARVDGLAAGAEVDVPLPDGLYIPLTAPSGNVYFGVIIDETGLVAETNESDNTQARPVTVVVDTDHDGVPDDVDLCPAVDASYFDANGDGCIDDMRSARHIEYWDAADFPLNYVINQDGAPGISDGSDFTAVEDGIATLSTVPGTLVSFSYAGTTPQHDAQALDGVNLVTFSDPDYKFPAGVLAVGISTSFTEPTFFNGQLVRPGKIVDADMIVNPTKSFRTPTAGSGVDLRSVVVHEAEHMIGLSHSAVKTSTLFFVLPQGSQAATLETEDQTLLFKAYGTPSALASASRLRGTVTDGLTSEPVPGAIVYAIDSVTGDSLACEYTLPDGSYDFVGLPNGDYFVAIHPLDGTSPIGFIQPANINSLVYDTAETGFGPEYWDAAESSTDDPSARTAVLVSAGTTATADLVTNIDLVAPTVVSTLPDSNATNVAYDGSILISFSEPIESGTLKGNFGLTDSSTGTFAGGNAAILNDDSLVAFIPTGGLKFSTTYKLRLGTGITDKSGNPLSEPFIIFFRTEPQPPLSITSLAPNKGVVGATVVINGFGFDSIPANNTVSFNGTAAAVLDANPSRLVVAIPAGAASGPVSVETALGSDSFPGFAVLSGEEVPKATQIGLASLGGVPRSLAVTPDGSRAFVATDAGVSAVVVNPGSPDFLSVAGAPITGGLNELDVTPDGGRVYGVSRVAEKLYRIGTAPGPIAVLNEANLGAEPRGVIVEPTGRRALVPTGDGEIQIWDINLASPTFEQRIGTIASPDLNLRGKMAIAPAGDRLLCLSGTGNLLVFDLGPDTLLTRIPVGPDPRDVVVDPTGERAYVSDETGEVTVVSLQGLFRVQTIATGGTLRGMSITPAGSFVHAANRELNFLDVIDLREGSPTYRNIALTIPQPINPVDVEITPDGFYALSITEATRQLAVTAVGVGPSIGTLSRVAGPVGAKVVLSGSGFTDAAATTVSFNGITAVPERLTDEMIVVSVPGGATSGPVTVVGTTPAEPTLVSNAVFFDVLAPTSPSFDRLRLSAALPAAPDLGVAGGKAVIAMSPEGDFAAVADDARGVHLLDTDPSSPTFNQYFGTINGTSVAEGLAVAPGGDRVFVALPASGHVEVFNSNRLSGDFLGPVGTIDLSSFEGSPNRVAVGPDGKVAVISDPAGNYVHVADIDPASAQAYQVIHSNALDGDVGETVFHPAGAFAYVAVPSLSLVYIIDTDAASPSFGSSVSSFSIPGPAPKESPISLSFAPSGSRCLILTSQLSGPANRSVFVFDTTNPLLPNAAYNRAFGGSSTPVVEHIDVSPRGDRAIFNVIDTGFFNLRILTSPDSLELLEQSGDASHHLSLVDNDFAVDASRFYSLSESRDSMFVYDFTNAENIAAISGNGQTGVVSQPLGSPLRVRVTTSTGDPVEGVTVSFNVTAGGGILAGTGTETQTVATDANGYAQVVWVLGGAVGIGAHTAVATAAGLSGAPLLFTADGVADPNLLPLVVSDIVPLDGTADVSVTTAIQTTFSRPVDPSSVTPATFFLHAGSPTPVPAVIGFSDANRKVSLTPVAPLAENTVYTIDVTTGIRDASAGPLTAAASTSFTTAGPPALAVGSISPPSGTVGITAVLSGTGFSTTPAQNTVLFNGTPGIVTAAGKDFLDVTVPIGATSGPVQVTVGASTSNTLGFTVLNPANSVVSDEVVASVGTSSAVRSISITPDGALAYAVSPNADVVIPIDIESLVSQPAIPVGDEPVAIVINPEGTLAYVANALGGTVSVIDIAPLSPTYRQVVETIPVGTAPVDLAIHPDGDRLYVVNGGSNDLSVVDTDHTSETFNQVLATAHSGSSTKSVAISPDGALLYVGTDDGYDVLDALGYSVLTNVKNGTSTKTVSITPDGALLIVLTTAGDIDIYDIVPGSSSENQVVAAVKNGTTTKSVSISPDGALLYLVQEEDDVIIVLGLDVLNSVGAIENGSELPPTTVHVTVVDTLTAGEDPSEVAIDPRGTGVVLVSNAGDNTVSVFDPSHSAVPIVADVEVNPRTLNLKSKGRYVEGRIELPLPYSARDIVVSSVLLQGVVPAETDGFSYEDKDADGLEELVVKFDRAAFQAAIPCGEVVPVRITGSVPPNTFAGDDTIRVIRPTLVYPTGEETLVVDQPVTISWSSPEGVAVDAVDVYWSPNDGADWYPVAEKIADHGSVAWTAPEELSGNYRILVTLFEGGEDIGAGITPKPFSVDAPVAVMLGAFSATVESRGVALHWETTFEYGAKGFHMLRSENEETGYERITTEAIASKASYGGAVYDFTDETARPNRTYFYKLEEITGDGTGQVFGPFEVTYRAVFSLEQNFPNPFNPSTRIRFTLPEDGYVSLVVYDVAGRVVRTLINERKQANHYDVEWDGRDGNGQLVASGVYFCKLQAGKHLATKKMLMMK